MLGQQQRTLNMHHMAPETHNENIDLGTDNLCKDGMSAMN